MRVEHVREMTVKKSCTASMDRSSICSCCYYSYHCHGGDNHDVNNDSHNNEGADDYRSVKQDLHDNNNDATPLTGCSHSPQTWDCGLHYLNRSVRESPHDVAPLTLTKRSVIYLCKRRFQPSFLALWQHQTCRSTKRCYFPCVRPERHSSHADLQPSSRLQQPPGRGLPPGSWAHKRT